MADDFSPKSQKLLCLRYGRPPQSKGPPFGNYSDTVPFLVLFSCFVINQLYDISLRFPFDVVDARFVETENVGLVLFIVHAGTCTQACLAC